MKVKALRTITFVAASERAEIEEGKKYDFSDELAVELLAAGYAEKIKEEEQAAYATKRGRKR